MASLGSLVAFIGADNTQLLRATRQSALAVQKMSKRISVSLLATGKTMENFGRTMTLGLTLPITLAGGAIVKLASDAEETSAKFGTVFQSVSKEANAMANELSTSFGLSRLESKTLLANTGDLLSGFGFTGEAALDLSSKVNKLAVDLASFTNLQGGSERASKALTKALIGERESAKELGIAILEADVKAEVARMTAQGLTFATERQAKAYATLNIALRQSKNAIGDFARTQTSVANQARIFIARLSDLAVQLGNFLLPAVNKILDKIILLVNKFIALDPQIKINIIVLAGLVAAIGPTIFLIGQLVSVLGLAAGAFGQLAGAITFAISPIGLVAAAMVGLVAIIIKLQKGTEVLGKIWVTFRVTLALALSGVGTLLKNMIITINAFLKGIRAIANAVGKEMPEGFNKAITSLEEFSSSMNDFANDNAKTAVDVSTTWDTAWTKFKTDMKDALEFGEQFAAEKTKKIQFLLKELAASLLIQPGVTDIGAGITPMPGGDDEQQQLNTSITAWQTWMSEQRNIAEVWRQTWSQAAVTVAEGFSQGFADMIVAGRSFKSVFTGLVRQVASDLIAQSVRSAIARLAIDQTVVAGNSAAAAPHPFLIPLFVGIGLAAFASAVSGTEGSGRTGVPGGGGGGGGGGRNATETAQKQIDDARFRREVEQEKARLQGGIPGAGGDGVAVSTVTGAQSEEGEGAAGDSAPMQTVVVQIDRETIVKAVVKGTRDGEGDGVESLALAGGAA